VDIEKIYKGYIHEATNEFIIRQICFAFFSFGAWMALEFDKIKFPVVSVLILIILFLLSFGVNVVIYNIDEDEIKDQIAKMPIPTA